MSDEGQPIPEVNQSEAKPSTWTSRHPKAMILLIAAVFYLILFGMCAFVFLLILRS